MNPDDLDFLRELTRAAIASATIPAGAAFTGRRPPQHGFVTPVNRLGFDAVRPGGRDCYPAVWVQDFTMTYSSGLVPPELGQRHLELFAAAQNGPRAHRLDTAAEIPPWAVPDHLNLDGSAVFFPGTYSSGTDQGGEPFGLRPPANNHFDLVWLAWMRWREEGGGAAFLRQPCAGLPLLDRLVHAFAAVETDPVTGLVHTVAERRFVGFIFCDTICMTGHLLFASLERCRAARQLAAMCAAVGDRTAAAALAAEAGRGAASIAPVFTRPDTHGGWLRAATGVSGQADVWGTIYALFLDVLPPDARAAAERQLRAALAEGTIEFGGAIRHVPTDRDAAPDSAWERTPTAHQTYQNGAYWHTPLGWAVHVLRSIAPDAAGALLRRAVEAFRADDFRQGPEHGAPWETIGPRAESYQNPVFVPSIALPYAVLTAPERHRWGPTP